METINYLNITIILLGIISLVFVLIRSCILATCFGLMSFLMGIYWSCFAPFPESLVGGLVVICGAIAIGKSDI